ncbi:MAG: ATP-binding protein, partial [Actinomycetes bacterium]
IWSADGTIVYSNESRLIGSRYPLGDEEQNVLRSGGLEAEVSDLSKPENRFEQSVGEMLEVYLPIRSPEGTPLLFEAYYSYDSVTSSAQRIWTQFAPIVTGGILLFGLLLLPIVWRLTTRLQRDQLQKERLLQSAIDASDNERSRIASDLHDGVVQDLSGVALTLAGTGAALPADSESARQVLNAARHTRGAVRALRSLLVEIYPPGLKDAGLENALLGLMASLNARGIATSLDMDPALRLPDQCEALVFRVAQEALRNVVRHAQAQSVNVALHESDGTVVLTITDDGIGVTDDALAHPEAGHVGLRLLTSLVTQASGALTVGPESSGGTQVRLELATR